MWCLSVLILYPSTKNIHDMVLSRARSLSRVTEWDQSRSRIAKLIDFLTSPHLSDDSEHYWILAQVRYRSTSLTYNLSSLSHISCWHNIPPSVRASCLCLAICPAHPVLMAPATPPPDTRGRPPFVILAQTGFMQLPDWAALTRTLHSSPWHGYIFTILPSCNF